MQTVSSVPTIDEKDTSISVAAAAYEWRWDRESDELSVRDAAGRRIVSGPASPALRLADMDGPLEPAQLQVVGAEVRDDEVAIRYALAGVDLEATVRWRFRADHVALAPVELVSSQTLDVVEIHQFATVESGQVLPGLWSTWLIHPGFVETSMVGVALPDFTKLDLRVWLGRGSHTPGEIAQQWSLPAHFLCGTSVDGNRQMSGAMTDRLSDAFCLGLAELPSSDHFLDVKLDRFSPVFQVRSDLWGQARTGAGPVAVGAEQVLAFGRTYLDALRSYYDVLVRDGQAVSPSPSGEKADTLRRAAWNTWGATVAEGPHAIRLTQEFLDRTYDDVRAAGFRPGMFVIDDKWESSYGLLEHDAERLPGFEALLQRVRDDGLKIGIWAAFMRCDDPSAVGLTEDHMIKGRDGKAITRPNWDERFYLYDPSNPETRAVLTRLIRAFARRYRPDLVKFDFGYEMPSLEESVPHDPSWGGEVLLRRCLEVVVGALRAELPDVAVMYYQLSPLFNDLIDLHAPDDLFGCIGDTAVSANRRLFLASPLVELGVPFYSSSGYDCESLQDVWFDAALFGPTGALVALRGDPFGAYPTRDDVARFNGIVAVGRAPGRCSVEPLAPNWLAGSAGARASGWIRREGDAVVGVALRPVSLDGRKLDGRVGDLISTTAKVLVVSGDEAALDSCATLHVVPFESGGLSVARPDARAALVQVVLADGSRRQWTADVLGGRLELELATQVDGVEVERLEVSFS